MKTINLISQLLSVIFLVTGSSIAHADSLPSQLEFKSPSGRFTILKKRGKYYLGNTIVSIEPIEPFLPLLQIDTEGPCPKLPKKPDLILTATYKGMKLSKRFYVNLSLLSDGKMCGDIEGQGVYYLPNHKNWFLPSKPFSIALGDTLLYEQNGETLFSFKKQNGHWQNENPEFIPNWNFFQDHIANLNDISIDRRVHPQISKGKLTFTLTTNNKKYRFFKISNTAWAIQLPKVPWLVASKNFYHLDNMKISQWTDRRAKEIYSAINPNGEFNDRMAAIKSLGDHWSLALKKGYLKVLLDPTDRSEIKLAMINRLKIHPSDENMQAMAQALSATEDRQVWYALINALRIRNPKGPKIDRDLESPDDNETIKYWQRWASDQFKK